MADKAGRHGLRPGLPRQLPWPAIIVVPNYNRGGRQDFTADWLQDYKKAIMAGKNDNDNNLPFQK